LENGDAGGIGAAVIGVGAAYFRTLAIPLRRGREFIRDDRAGTEPVAVVSETLARQLWPNAQALGGRIRTIEQTGAGPVTGPWRTVVGVAGDVRQTYDDHDQKDIYVPFLQTSLGRFASFYMRTAQAPSVVAPVLRAAIAEVDRQAVLPEPISVASEDRQRARTRFLTSALTSFATFASLLAMLGVYGTIAYAVQQREREIAIRIAIGAPRDAIIALFLADGGRVVIAGIALGLVGALWLARLLTSQLVGVNGFDATTIALASGIIAAAGLAAIWWPARRAAATNPVAALNALD
jgi:ABC-type antimicrobial peptide transport system permease subunit